ITTFNRGKWGFPRWPPPRSRGRRDFARCGSGEASSPPPKRARTEDVPGRSTRASGGRGRRAVLHVHQRAREQEVGGRAVAGGRDVADDRDTEQRLHVDVVWMGFERVPEEDDEIGRA